MYDYESASVNEYEYTSLPGTWPLSITPRTADTRLTN